MRYLYFVLLFFIFSCGADSLNVSSPESTNIYFWKEGKVDAQNTLQNRIAPPDTYKRVKGAGGSFGDWLRNLPLKPEGATVSLFDGTQKENQSFHVAVIDMDVDSAGLQKAPQSIMRLNTEYHFGREELDKIQFRFTGKNAIVPFTRYAIGEKPIVVEGQDVLYFYSAHGYPDSSYANLKNYLGEVYTHTKNFSVHRDLKKINLHDIQLGDIFVKNGDPEYAVLVADVVQNESGYKMFLLAQGGTPAQDFHILKNPNNAGISPWYSVINSIGEGIKTHEYSFTYNDLYRFEEFEN